MQQYIIDKMPNIVTHAYITDTVHGGASTDLILGSTLPDFAGMYRDYEGAVFRVSDIHEPPAFRGGIDFHNKTDQAFDALPARLQLLADGQADCVANIRAISPQVAKVLANIGTDILLDAVMLETEPTNDVYRHLKTEVAAGRTALKGSLPTGFTGLIESYFHEDRAYKYQDTEWLAEVMRRRLSLRKRPGLSFGSELSPLVAAMLGRQLGRIRECALPLIDDTVTALKN